MARKKNTPTKGKLIGKKKQVLSSDSSSESDQEVLPGTSKKNVQKSEDYTYFITGKLIVPENHPFRDLNGSVETIDISKFFEIQDDKVINLRIV